MLHGSSNADSQDRRWSRNHLFVTWAFNCNWKIVFEINRVWNLYTIMIVFKYMYIYPPTRLFIFISNPFASSLTSMALIKRNTTLLPTYQGYVYFALNHRYKNLRNIFSFFICQYSSSHCGWWWYLALFFRLSPQTEKLWQYVVKRNLY